MVLKIDFVCIGNPRIVGDSVGPMFGTSAHLHTFNYDVNIVGTVENPITVSNYEERIKEVRPDSTVIVIDAVLGDPGELQVVAGSMQPGAGMGLQKIPIGDISIKCPTGTTLGEILQCGPDLICKYIKDIYRYIDIILYLFIYLFL